MTDLEPLLQKVTEITPLAMGLVALAGLIVGIAPSSFPRLSVAVGLAAGRGVASATAPRIERLWISAGFALSIAAVETMPWASR